MFWISLSYCLIFVVPPVMVALLLEGFLALIGWPRVRLLWAAPVILAAVFGTEALALHLILAPSTPDLTRDQAAKLLRSRPEFTSRGRAPVFESIRRSNDSQYRDFESEGDFTFLKSNGERETNAVAQFYFQNGHWMLLTFRYGPAIEPVTVIVSKKQSD